MSKPRNELQAGLFILVSGLLAGGVYLGVRGTGMSLESKSQHTVAFALSDDVGGLRAGSEVRMGGLKVGQVTSVRVIATGETPEIVAEFSIPQRFSLKPDAQIEVQATLTGAVNLNISSLGIAPHSTATMPDETPFRGRGSALNRLVSELALASTEINHTVRDVRGVTLPKVNTALEQTGPTIDAIRATSNNANELITQARTKVEPIVERYNKAADAATVAMTEVGELAGGGKADFRQTLANARQATGDLKDRLPALLDKTQLAIDDLRGSLGKASAALEDVKAVAVNAREATASARTILTTNRGRIDEMAKSLRDTATNLEAASVDIRRSPWRLLYKPSGAEVANLNLYDSARHFAEVSQNLTDATLALRDAASDPDVDPKQMEKLVTSLDQAFVDLKKVEETLWNSLK